MYVWSCTEIFPKILDIKLIPGFFFSGYMLAGIVNTCRRDHSSVNIQPHTDNARIISAVCVQ